MKYYNWDTDGKGHMWSYETPEGAWVSRSAAESRIRELEAVLEAALYCPEHRDRQHYCRYCETTIERSPGSGEIEP